MSDYQLFFLTLYSLKIYMLRTLYYPFSGNEGFGRGWRVACRVPLRATRTTSWEPVIYRIIKTISLISVVLQIRDYT